MSGIGNRLAPAEASVRDLLLISPDDVAGQAAPKTPAEAVSGLGANLVLATSLRPRASGFALDLRLLDAASTSILRHDTIVSSSAELNRLADRASVSAAQWLGIRKTLSRQKDDNELATVAPAAYRAFVNAENLMSQPNDTGLDGAIEQYQKAVDTDPHFALGYAKLSMAYTRKFYKSRERAVLSLAATNAAAALRYNPNSAKAVLSQALVDLYSGNTQKAIDGMNRARQLDPGNPQIQLYKARAFQDLDQTQAQQNVYREILKDRPNFWPAYNELGVSLYRQGRYQEAGDAFAEGSAVAPRIALLLTNRGSMLILLKQESEAEEAFRQSLERAPSAIADQNLGFIAFEHADYRTALDYFGRARDLRPKNDVTWRNIGDCYAMLGQPKLMTESYAKAADVLAEFLRTNPRRGASWMTLAFYQAKLGRRSDAEASLKEAEQRGAGDVESQFHKAQALALLGRAEEALRLILKCLDRGLSPVEVEQALDLQDVRADPRYRRSVAQLPAKQ